MAMKYTLCVIINDLDFSLSKIGNGYLVIFKYKEFSSEYFLNQHCGIILELIEIQILLPLMEYSF